MSDNGHMPPFGRLLKSRRVEQGIGLETIAARTRIPLQTLMAIEAEEHAQLPAEVFMKGFLRACARQVGADAEEVLQHYQASRAIFQEGQQRLAQGRRKGRTFRRGLYVALALLALTGVAATIYVLRWRAPQRVAAAPVMAVPPGSANPPAAVAPADSGAAPAERAPLPATAVLRVHQLSVLAVADTRIKVLLDNRTTREANLRAGDRLAFEAEKGFSLLLGNPAAVQLTLDGQPVKVPPPGKGGQAMTLQLP